LKVGRVGDSLIDWDREFQRMGKALEKSWRRAWEEETRELESRRSWEERTVWVIFGDRIGHLRQGRVVDGFVCC
ncbi:unnamed protein product, partial [Staurois parvus]